MEFRSPKDVQRRCKMALTSEQRLELPLMVNKRPVHFRGGTGKHIAFVSIFKLF